MSRERAYLTVGPNPRGDGLLAVISIGSPQMGDKDIDVLSVKVVADMEEAREWLAEVLAERPYLDA